jgi:hypothetical protein
LDAIVWQAARLGNWWRSLVRGFLGALTMANINDVYQIRIVGISGGQASINVLHYLVTAKAGTGATDGTIAAAVSTAIKVGYKSLMETTTTYRGVGAKRIFPVPPGVETAVVSDTGFGSGGTGQAPTQCCGLITWRTAVGSRHGRGRMYTPFCAVTDLQTNGYFSAAYIVKLNGIAGTLSTPIVCGVTNTNTLSLIIWDRKNQVAYPVTNWTAGNFVATQRRRGSFGRPNLSPF